MSISNQTDELAKFVLQRFLEYSTYRDNTRLSKGYSVTDWIERCALAYNKEHHPSDLCIDGYKGMRGYFGALRIKVDSAMAQTRDLLGERIHMPWVFNPTPNPDLSKAGREKVKQKLAAAIDNELKGRGIEVTPEMYAAGIKTRLELVSAAYGGKIPEELEEWLTQYDKTAGVGQSIITEELKIAKKACDTANVLAQDWQRLSGFANAHIPMLRDAYGSVCGVMAGPFDSLVEWRTYKGNTYKSEYVDGYGYRHIQPINALFAPDASNASNGGGFIEICSRTERDLLNMLLLGDDVNKNNIEQILGDSSRNETYQGQWLGSIRERTLSAGVGIPSDVSLGGNTQSTYGYEKTYESIIFSGNVSGRELDSFGITGYERNKTYSLKAEICGNLSIYALISEAPSPRGYISTGYGDGTIPWRESIVMAGYDSQRRINQLVYRMVQARDQQSGASVGYSGVAFDGGIKPFKPFSAVALSGVGNDKPYQMYQAQPIFQHLYGELINEMYLIDMETGIPRFDRDVSGTAETTTATEAGIRYKTSVQRQKQFIHNVDLEVYQPAGAQVYEWVLKKNPRLQGLADAMVDAKGIVGGLSEGANKASLANVLPVIMNGVSMGLVPPEAAKVLLRTVAEGVGMPMDSWADPRETQQIANAVGAAQSPLGTDTTPAVMQPNTLLGDEIPQGMVAPNDARAQLLENV